MAGRIGARVRGMHRTIKGDKPDGSRYSAMEPDAFAWVHATLAVAVLDGHRHLAREMTREEAQAFWTQWRDVGRLVGVRYRDLPETVEELEAYVARMVADELEWTPAVDDVMATLVASRPPFHFLPAVVWRVLSFPVGWHGRVTTVGLMPAVLRERLRLPFSSFDARAFRVLSALSRASGPLIRGPLRDFGPYYVRARRGALARGDVASVDHPPRRRRAASAA
jgi:uncharacterized protein (DUF2236 family)